jgi:hypothetical protein
MYPFGQVRPIKIQEPLNFSLILVQSMTTVYKVLNEQYSSLKGRSQPYFSIYNARHPYIFLYIYTLTHPYIF